MSWTAVLVGGVFNTVLGALWHGPLSGRAWLRATGEPSEEIKSDAAMYVLPLPAGLVEGYVLAVMIVGLGILVWWQGTFIGAFQWLGIGAIGVLTVGTFEDSPRSA